QGNAQWIQDGIQITDLTISQDEPVIIQDGNGGAIICWEDLRDSNFDIYAQRIDPSGNALWQSNGIAISTANGSQRYMSMISDLNSGAYIVWEDRRSGTNGDDAYAQQVNSNGVIGVVTEVNEIVDLPSSFYLSQNYPNPFNPVTNIKYFLSEGDHVKIKLYDMLGIEIKTLVNEFKNAGEHNLTLNASSLVSGVYCYRMQAGDFLQTKKLVLLK
ncbi:MAG: T9SS type A sorting domain-containing protein, partial [Nitrososphaeraceae archaeon]|nr:T9SS type A sorting domain-containing protein [Nitrososphaeraceae archaeon]